MGYIPPPPPRVERVFEGMAFTDDSAVAVNIVPRRAPEGFHWVASTAIQVGKGCFHVQHRFESDMGYNGPPTAWHLANQLKPTVHANACHYCGRGRTSGNLTCDGCGAPVEIKSGPPRNPRKGLPIQVNPTRRIWG